MIYDKTSYAIELGLGGIMTWTATDDKPYENPLSLHRAIEEVMVVRGCGLKSETR